MNSCTYICDIDAEEPFLKYVCIFLLYAHDCNKYSFDETCKFFTYLNVWCQIRSNRMKYDADFRKTFSFFSYFGYLASSPVSLV